jgi:hypothetical protein
MVKAEVFHEILPEPAKTGRAKGSLLLSSQIGTDGRFPLEF